MTKQEYIKTIIDDIKDNNSKDRWSSLIKVAMAKPLPGGLGLEELAAPCNIQTVEADKHKVRAILFDDQNYIVRYMRHEPTVGLATVPVRRPDGTVAVMKGEGDAIVDMPWVRKRVICAGIPHACVIAFLYDHKLLIGWSKRVAEKSLIETPDLHELFRAVLENTKTVTETSDNYQVNFDVFCRQLMSVLSYSPAKDIEQSFSKKAGKAAAITRALNDTIIINGNYVSSGASGPVPHEIARNLKWFVAHAEETYGGKAANVSYPELSLVNVPAEV
jgi:hypothetical protein